MKKVLLMVLWVLSTGAFAQGIKTPAPSPGQSIKQDFSLSAVEVKYSRPVIKGRKIFGDVVPFGKLWRTGANSPTSVTFGEDVKIAGQALKAGTYQLLTIPSQFSWEIIFNKGTKSKFARSWSKWMSRKLWETHRNSVMGDEDTSSVGTPQFSIKTRRPMSRLVQEAWALTPVSRERRLGAPLFKAKRKWNSRPCGTKRGPGSVLVR